MRQAEDHPSPFGKMKIFFKKRWEKESWMVKFSGENKKNAICRANKWWSKDYEVTSKSGGSTTGASTFTGSGGGGDGGFASSTSGVFLYSMAIISLGASTLLSTICVVEF